uniref:Reverse transcriptase domain-containing protein n=1 Tax=Haemonchus contortus TaxID=6289 RepID=A0A7I5EA38_HAECO
GGIERIRENLRRYFDREFERMRKFNEQFYEKIGSPNARRTGSPNAQDYKKGEARVRAFAKNFRKLQKLLQRQRSKRFSDRRAGETSSTLTKKRTENRETTITNGRGYPTSGSGSFHVNS